MALTKSLPCDRSVISRYRTGSQQGVGKDPHLLVGPSGSGDSQYRHRSFLRFDFASSYFTDVKQIIKAEIVLRTEENATNHWTAGSNPQVRARLLKASFTEGSGTENQWTSTDYRWPSLESFNESTTPIRKQDNLTVYLDVTRSIGRYIPASVLDAAGNPGQRKTNYGYSLIALDERASANRVVFLSRHTGTSTARPYLLLTYEPKNRAPVAPTLTDPPTTTGPDDSFAGLHSDPDGDPLAAYEIIVYPKGVTTPVWTAQRTASSDETAANRFSVPLTQSLASLKSQTDYEWKARTKDPSGLWGPYSALRALRLTSAAAPTVTASNLGQVSVLTGVRFVGAYSDPDGDPLSLYRIQLQPASFPPGDPNWDASPALWDTGEVAATAQEIRENLISKEYGGQSLPSGLYRYRVSGRDNTGLWSAWSYGDIELTQDYITDPGEIDLITQSDRDAPIRVALYGMGTNRGPGALIGWVEDPINLGASGFLNGGGEVYFTLPALHPYCPFIEPMQTHYVVEQWWGDRFRPLFEGLITDFDATPEEVVFYGIDYLGLYQTAVDERYNPDKPDLAADGNGGGGSKYTDKTIDYVIRDQLRYHQSLANSKVGFIQIGAISALAERVTIYSTYSEALPFMVGLIDSHKGGTGREARLYVRRRSTTGHEILLTDNWGKDRPNIRLEYGGLLNEFRVVALGDFATRVLGVGQKRGEVKVYRSTGTSGLDESIWGRTAKSRYWPDIIDQNDLTRRSKEAASQYAKVGKRMALAIRADALVPFDGWDLGDNIWVDIDRGVVDSSRYGSEGMWTVYGVEFRYFPDGHHEVTLTILPKKTAEAPDPDLIPSKNPGIAKEWQTGYGVPTQYGEPPQPTPTTPIPTFFNDYGDFTYEWRFNTGTTPPPAQGAFKSSVATPTIDFDLYFSQFSRDDIDRSLEFSAVVPGTRIYIRVDGATTYWVGQVRSAPIDNGDYWTFPITRLSEGVETLPSNNTIATVTFLFRGNETYYPPTADPVTAKWYEDLNTGYVYELVEDTGQYRLVYTPQSGGTAPVPVDTEPPPIPVLKSLVSVTSQQPDSTTLTGIGALVGYNSPPNGLIDLARIEIQTTRFSTENPDPEQEALPNWTVASIWSNASADKTGTLDTYVVAASVLAATRYWVRARAIDDANNRSSWTDYQSITTAEDTDGPPRPSGIVVEAGMNALGIRWDDIEAVDLSYVEVEWRVPPDGNWASARIDGTLIVVTGLVNDTAYEVRLRSVDTSGNTLHDTGTVDPEGNPIYETFKATDREKGWVEVPGTFTPTAIPGDTLVWDEAIIENVFAGMINADWITAGTLTVGNGVDGITVVDALGNVVGRWNPNGLEVLDPANPQYFLRITESSLIIWDTTDPLNPIERVRLTPRGIDAASITFGSARGGHNLIQNSSFELGRYGVTAITENVWDVQSDWDASRIGSDTNVTTGASTLTMTSVT